MKVKKENNIIFFLKKYVQQSKSYTYVLTNMRSDFVTIYIRNTFSNKAVLSFVIKKSALIQIEKAKRVYAKNIHN